MICGPKKHSSIKALDISYSNQKIFSRQLFIKPLLLTLVNLKLRMITLLKRMSSYLYCLNSHSVIEKSTSLYFSPPSIHWIPYFSQLSIIILILYLSYIPSDLKKTLPHFNHLKPACSLFFHLLINLILHPVYIFL